MVIVRFAWGGRFAAVVTVIALVGACGGGGESGSDEPTEEDPQVESTLDDEESTGDEPTEDDHQVESNLGEEEATRGEPIENEHQVEFAIGENEFVTRFVVPVDGYRYKNYSAGAYEDLGVNLAAMEAQIGDLFGATSLHSVVADDPSQNTAPAWNGDWEVGYLVLAQINDAIPFGADESLPQLASDFGDQIDRLNLSGTPVFVFENPDRPDSRFHYTWLDQGVWGTLDGADRAPLERWLAAYLAVPKLAVGETVELAERLVELPGLRYTNVDPENTFEQLPPLDGPHSLHFVADGDGIVGTLALVPSGHVDALQEWMMEITDFRASDDIDVYGYPVGVFDGTYEVAYNVRSIGAYEWDDGQYAGVLTTNAARRDDALAFIEGFLGGTETDEADHETTEAEVTRPWISSHVLVAEFGSEAAPFPEGETTDYVFGVVNGEYKVSAKTGSPSSPAVSFAWLERTAQGLEAEVTVVRVPDPDSAGVGIACIPEGVETPVSSGGFLFVVGGSAAVLAGTWSDDDPSRTVPMTLEAGQRIGINCQSATSTLDQPVQATIDGQVILEVPNEHPEGFDRLALVFFQSTSDEADFAVFDNVTASVP